MLNKETRLKKILIRNSTISAVFLISVIVAAFLLSNYGDDLVNEKVTKQSTNESSNSEIIERETSLGLNSMVTKDYKQYVKDRNPSFDIKRDTLSELFLSLRKQHHFTNNMEATISSINEVSGTDFKLKTGKIVQSNINISFNSLTDNSVYNLIYDLQHKLPGLIMVSGLKLTRMGDISRDVASLAVDKHIISPVVKGEISFVWFGIRTDKKIVSSPEAGQNDGGSK